MEDPTTAHYKISNRGSQVLDFLSVGINTIHDAMHLNKTSRTSSGKTGPHIKNTAVYLTVDMGYFLSLFVLNPAGMFADKNLFF